MLTATLTFATTLDAAEPPRYSVNRTSTGVWTLVKPDGTPTWLTAINHLSAFKCHPEDAECLKTDALNTRFKGNWSALAESFVADLRRWGFSSAGYGQGETNKPGQPTYGGLSGWQMYPYFPHVLPTHASSDAPGGFSLSDVFEDSFEKSVASQVEGVTLRVRVAASNAVGYYFQDIPTWARAAPSAAPNGTSGTCCDMKHACGTASSVCHNATSWCGKTEANCIGKCKSRWCPNAPIAVAASAPAWTHFMRTAGPAAAGKQRYVDWLRTRYGADELARVCDVYNIHPAAASWDALRAWPFADVDPGNATVTADDLAFLGVVADRIYSVTTSAVRSRDPGALIFGDRFIQTDMPDAVLAAAARHFDVLTIQPQPFSFDGSAMLQASVAALTAVATKLGMPLMIADQATHYPDPYLAAHGQPPVRNCDKKPSKKGGGCVADEATAGAMYGEYLDRLHATGVVIGYAHCEYIDRRFSAADNVTKQGLRHYDGSPRSGLIAAVTKANQKHSGNGAGLPGPAGGRGAETAL